MEKIIISNNKIIITYNRTEWFLIKSFLAMVMFAASLALIESPFSKGETYVIGLITSFVLRAILQMGSSFMDDLYFIMSAIKNNKKLE